MNEIDVWTELYAVIATAVLNVASWVLDQYIAVIERLDWRVIRWKVTHIAHVGPLRIKFHREYICVYTIRRILLLWKFR
jgi:hypothetical protein